MGWFSRLKEGRRRRRLEASAPGAIFADYFHQNKWGDGESLSGKGSNLASTEGLRGMLPAILHELGAASLLDLPCGDFHWMAQVDLSGIDYLGGDIVPELIARNSARHARPGVAFRVIDLIAGPVPAADVILCRDCLVHLSNDHARAALDNIRRSGATWLLTTTFPDSGSNADIATGQWRAIDLTRPPFLLPPPERMFRETFSGDKGQQSDKHLGLWHIDSLPPPSR
jgi:SAM-dependent methyltransferase